MELHEDRPFPLVDTHAHLTWPSFTDVAEVVNRARAAGVGRILSAATDARSARAALDLASMYPEVFVAVGIHPNDVAEDEEMAPIADLAAQPRVVAIGETGLDYYRDSTDPALQRRSFAAHLELAAGRDLPIVVHNRQADDDVLAALRPWSGRIRGVLHCFSGDIDLAERALDLGFCLSFAGNLTYPSASALRMVAAWAPEERLLVETDAPFLAPVPVRGRRNEPAHVTHTLEALARARDCSPETLARQIVANAQTLFGW
jgi:TatD DNase family protein